MSLPDPSSPDLAASTILAQAGADCAPLALTLPADPPLPPWRLPQVPGYETLEEVGRGGMGVVYKARQKGLGRLVALKMLLASERLGRTGLRRFHLEAETVARLRHPNIVQVHELGWHEGLPFLVMEFVEGGTLAELVNRTTPRRSAELVRDLAAAIAHAHAQGIVHRDLKPANILLSSGEWRVASGEQEKDSDLATRHSPLATTPKITDFGLAKYLDEQGITREGAVMGTPSYMAPEQAQGRIGELTPATDVYALGAILYELLTGRPPFRGETAADLISQLVQDEPVPPARLNPGVPRDLETICLKCLAKDRTRRYPSGAELAEDLGRFLSGEAIRARRTPAWERAWKWARRRPAQAALAGMAGVLVLTGVLGSLWWGQHERQRAEEATRLQHRSAANARQAHRAIRELVEASVFRLAPQPHAELLRHDLLLRALAFYRDFLEQNGPDPSDRREVAVAWVRAAEIEALLGRADDSEKSYRAGLADLQRLSSESDDREVRQELAAAWNGLALLHQQAGRRDDARNAFTSSITLREELWNVAPEDRTARLELASGLDDRGNFHHVTGDARHAEADYLRALRLALEMVRDSPREERCLRQLAHAHFNLATLWTTSRPADAAREYSAALPLWEALRQGAPDAPHYRRQLAVSLLNRGVLRQLAGQLADAEPDCRRALGLLTELADQFRRVPDYQRLHASAMVQLAELLRRTSRPAEAVEAWQQAVTLLRRLSNTSSDEPQLRQRLGRALNDLAICLFQIRRLDEAEAAWRDAVSVQQELVDRHPRETVHREDLGASLGNLLEALSARGRQTEAEPLRRRLDELKKG